MSMTSLLGVVWSAPFLLGLVLGAVAMRGYMYLKCEWMNRHYPLPDGKKRHPPPFARTWLGGLFGAMVVLYVLAQTQQTHDDTVALSGRTQSCVASLIEAVNARADLNDRRDDLSEEQRVLFDLIDHETNDLLRKVIVPPPAIAALPTDNRQRREWLVRAQIEYDAVTAPWRERSREITTEVESLNRALDTKPLPTPRCFADG